MRISKMAPNRLIFSTIQRIKLPLRSPFQKKISGSKFILKNLIYVLVNEYNVYWIFWVSIFRIPNLYLLTTIVLFLTIDRCIILKLPLNYHHHYRRINLHLAFLVTFFIWIINQFLHIFWNYPHQADNSILNLNIKGGNHLGIILRKKFF